MPVKSDRWIKEMCIRQEMIKPFFPDQVRKGISFGLSSYGYDISLGDEFKLFEPKQVSVIDPKVNNSESFRDVKAKSVLIQSNSFILARTKEYFKIPRNILTICTGKSTYARVGVIVNVTPFEPEWEGFATISLANSAPVQVRVYAGEGIGQLIFLESDEICETSYADKKGKYQSQQAITLSKSD